MEDASIWSAGLYALLVSLGFMALHILIWSLLRLQLLVIILVLLGSSMCSVHGFAALAGLMS